MQAFVNQRNHRGTTALDMAVSRTSNASDLAQALRDAGGAHSDVWERLSPAERTRENLDHFDEWQAINANLSVA